MDRQSWIGVICCLALLMGWNFYSAYRWPYHPPKPAPAATASATATLSPSQSSGAVSESSTPSLSSADPATQLPEQKIPVNAGPEQTAILENDVLIAHFSSLGGSIKTIELKKHAAEGNLNISLNRDGAEGIFNLTGWDGEYTQVPYKLETQGDTVVFLRTLPSGAVVKRTYHLGAGYQLFLDQSVTNPTAKDIDLPVYHLNVGTAGPIHSEDSHNYITSGYCPVENVKFHKVSVLQFAASTFPLTPIVTSPAKFSIESQGGALLWASVQNQFFTLLLAPEGESELQKSIMYPVKLPAWGVKSAPAPEGINAQAWQEGFKVAAGQTVDRQYSLYAGPKEYGLLKTMGRNEDLVMDFGMFGWIIRPLLYLMQHIHNFIPNWGWTIVVMTVLIKAALWPLQSIANKSMKQMQALQPKMEALRQKYKDDPQKMNTETMQLYREYGVNPAGGCLPMLVQMPIFLGFYFMLQSAVEFRGASFLWVHDLVRPDTIAKFNALGHEISINPLPILMAATQFMVMKMTPQQGGDNPQAKMMQWMPILMLFILYKFAAALALYWTVSNLITMVQTYINLRRPVPVLKRVPKKRPALT